MIIKRHLILAEKKSGFLVREDTVFMGVAELNGEPVVLCSHDDTTRNVLERRTLWNLAVHPDPSAGLVYIGTIPTAIGNRHIYWEEGAADDTT